MVNAIPHTVIIGPPQSLEESFRAARSMMRSKNVDNYPASYRHVLKLMGLMHYSQLNKQLNPQLGWDRLHSELHAIRNSNRNLQDLDNQDIVLGLLGLDEDLKYFSAAFQEKRPKAFRAIMLSLFEEAYKNAFPADAEFLPSDLGIFPVEVAISGLNYIMQTERQLPTGVKQIIELAHEKGFQIGLQRKPVTFGCPHAAKWRIDIKTGEVGIDLDFEFKGLARVDKEPLIVPGFTDHRRVVEALDFHIYHIKAAKQLESVLMDRLFTGTKRHGLAPGRVEPWTALVRGRRPYVDMRQTIEDSLLESLEAGEVHYTNAGDNCWTAVYLDPRSMAKQFRNPALFQIGSNITR